MKTGCRRHRRPNTPSRTRARSRTAGGLTAEAVFACYGRSGEAGQNGGRYDLVPAVSGQGVLGFFAESFAVPAGLVTPHGSYFSVGSGIRSSAALYAFSSIFLTGSAFLLSSPP